MLSKLHDQRHKALLGTFYELWAAVYFEREVRSQKQAIDMLVVPRPDIGQGVDLPLLRRMSEHASCMFELFYNTPGVDDIDACVRKQLVFHQDQILRAGRENRATPDKPILWILSTGKPVTVLKEYEARPMDGWPSGFYNTREADALRIVAINQLPATRETLIVRLLGRGPTLREAIEELHCLTDSCLERRLAMPVLLEFPGHLPQDHVEEDDLNIVQQIREKYAGWETRALREGRRQGKQQGKRQGKRELLLRLLGMRFAPLPDHVVRRVKRADEARLETWAERFVGAEQLEEIFES